MNRRYIVAGSKPWSKEIFNDIISSNPGQWHYVENPDELESKLSNLSPHYIFFLHWSWIVPKEIVNKYDCVCFHMTDVPYGRGGSPLQNLIQRGFKQTKLTALKMVNELDAGPVYMKKDLSLEGRAEDIYQRASGLAADMISIIIHKNPLPTPQFGEPTYFTRRTPAESCIEKVRDLEQLYDFIRMLDAEGYPPAYVEQEGIRLEFTEACHQENQISAKVVITLTGGNPK